MLLALTSEYTLSYRYFPPRLCLLQCDVSSCSDCYVGKQTSLALWLDSCSKARILEERLKRLFPSSHRDLNAQTLSHFTLTGCGRRLPHLFQTLHCLQRWCCAAGWAALSIAGVPRATTCTAGRGDNSCPHLRDCKFNVLKEHVAQEHVVHAYNAVRYWCRSDFLSPCRNMALNPFIWLQVGVRVSCNFLLAMILSWYKSTGACEDILEQEGFRAKKLDRLIAKWALGPLVGMPIVLLQ